MAYKLVNMCYKVFNEDCFVWMEKQPENSVTAIVTDPPYGVKEYTEKELVKKRSGSGGIWRIPQKFDGCTRQPVPRFSVINDDPEERKNVYSFFEKWAVLAKRILVPGGHIFLASTPLLSDIVGSALRSAGLEKRGEIIRSVCTLRGGDRPKNAEDEFPELSVIPKALWEPWCLYRKPLAEKTVAENLRIWKAGALRRPTIDRPFADFIQSEKTPKIERNIVNHPSIKPQSFLRQIVRAALPLGEGTVLDPFSGSGSTLAAADFLGYDCIGVEKDSEFYRQSLIAIPKLSKLYGQTTLQI